MANRRAILDKRNLELLAKADQLVAANLVPDTIMLEDYYDPLTTYSPDEKLVAVAAYMVYGRSTLVEKHTGIPAPAVRYWKTRTDWWIPTLAYLRKNKQDELDAAVTRVIDTGITALEERIKLGDEKTDKTGAIYRVKVPAKDLAYITSVMIDKRNLMRGDPTSIQGKSINNLEEISKTLLDTVAKAKEEKVVNTIPQDNKQRKA